MLALVVTPYDDGAKRILTGPPFPPASAPPAGATSIGLTGGETKLYFSDAAYVTGGGDTPPHQFFEPRLATAYNLEARLFEGDEPAGHSQVGFGAVTIRNGEGGFDPYLTYGWDGRDVALYQGGPSDAFTAFDLVFRGTAAGIVWDEADLRIRLRDRQAFVDLAINPNTFAGTGQLEGNIDVKGRPKPQGYGKVRNVGAVLIDPANQVYQVSDRPIQAIDAVKDKGVALTDEGDVADLYAASAPAAGKFKTNLANGAFRLGASPDGTVTCDFQGDAQGGYVSTTAGILRRIVTTRLGGNNLSDPAGLDTASFTQVNTDQPGVIGLWIGTETRNVGDVLDEIMGGAGGFWFFTRTGLASIGIFKGPGASTATISAAAGDIAETGIERIRDPRPSTRREVAYRRMWLVQPADDLAGSVSDADRAELSRASRAVSALDSTVRTKFRLALEVTTPSLFDVEADAQAEADRLLALHKVRRDVYRIPLSAGMFKYWLGQTVTLTAPRFDLAAGKAVIIIGMTEDAAAGDAVLEVWG